MSTGPFRVADVRAHFPLLHFPRDFAGIRFPEGVTRVHLGLVVGIVMIVVVWFLQQRTSFGFDMKVVGTSERASGRASERASVSAPWWPSSPPSSRRQRDPEGHQRRGRPESERGEPVDGAVPEEEPDADPDESGEKVEPMPGDRRVEPIPRGRQVLRADHGLNIRKNQLIVERRTSRG